MVTQRTPLAVNSNNNTPLPNKRLRSDEDWQMSVSPDYNANGNSITLDGMLRMMMQQYTETGQLIDIVRTEIMDVISKSSRTTSNRSKTNVQRNFNTLT